jgi:hypothetical protein
MFSINSLVNVASLILLILCFETWRGDGILIWLLGTAAFMSWRIYRQRTLVMNLMRQVETTIWGKPLDKDLWDDGELKKTKIKLKWGKKEDGKKRNEK